MSQSNHNLRIDIVSDVVCPWRIIGYQKLEQTMAETGTSATLSDQEKEHV